MIKYSHLGAVAWSITWRFFCLLPLLTVATTLFFIGSANLDEPSPVILFIYAGIFYVAIYLSLLWTQKRGAVLLVAVERDND
ncbi:hypothetical protein MMH89_03045 [Candidatus Comchoanobacter bicostacola]|uniref:Uncharacterized protein n=1 Tax=Candidatus Comchoanobacter bicostacola TaxID=2919598 RepID=A0ABY5DHP8_9GAMM|nr:hypothetical protein [Candidatus Comchoanobacter bicostacola]UTC24198.1 hypothetical protein MMH89_03045 [Candidatus Comchoanobacter bicostacola]